MTVDKLGLPTQVHPAPYSIESIISVGEMKVTKQCFISFTIGEKYKDEVLFDVVDMDTCHMILGRPWQCDMNCIYNGRENTFTFYKDGVKIILTPIQESQLSSSQKLFSLFRKVT